MRNIKLMLLLLVFLFTACKKNEDITVKKEVLPKSIQVVSAVLKGYIKTEVNTLVNANSIYANTYSNRIHNAQVQLSYEGNILATTNTDGNGYYEFEEQQLPLEGILIKASAPNYFPNLRKLKIDTSTTGDIKEDIDLLPLIYNDLVEENISSDDPKINLTGWLKGNATLYLKDSNGHLVGNWQATGEDPIIITTNANEKLFLYTQKYCDLPEPIELGPFSEDTDIGTIDVMEDYTGKFTSLTAIITDCSGSPKNAYLSTRLGPNTTASHFNYATSNFYHAAFAFDCQVENVSEFTVTAFDPDNYDYFGETTVPYTPGQDLIADISICTPNETFFKYKVGIGTEIVTSSFSFANLMSNGSAVLDIEITPFKRIKLGVTGISVGNHTGEMLFKESSLVYLTGESMMVTISVNDGEYVEGNFTGLAFDPLENALGELTGSFKAKIR